MLNKTLKTALLLSLVTATVAGAETVERDFDESFDVTSGTTLRLIHGDGDVDIRPWNEDRLRVSVRYHVVSKGFGGSKDFEVDFDHSGDSITVEGREIGSNFFFGGSRTYEYRYTIQAPSYLILDLVGDDGDIEITDWEASIDLRSEDGDVTIDGLDGDLDVRLDDGDIELFDCAVGKATLQLEDGDVTLRRGSGEWHFSLDDGDLDLRDLAATVLEARTEDGDIRADLSPAASFEGELRSDDGDVTLGLYSGFSARFSIEVDDGSIGLRADDITVETKGKHETSGVIGGGAGELQIRTSDGDVTLRESN